MRRQSHKSCQQTTAGAGFCRAHPALIPGDRRKKMLSLEMKLTRGRFDCYKSPNDYILPPIWSWTPFNSSSRASVCRGPLHSATHILCKPGSTLHSARHMLCKWCAGINLLVQHIGGNLNSVPCRRTPGAR